MPVYGGSLGIGAVNAGGYPIASIYAGSQLVWSAETWDFHDDFERSSIGSAWTGSGGVIAGSAPNRYLRKNTTAGSADYWTAQQFTSDDIEVLAKIGVVGDVSQLAAVVYGNSNQYVSIEFSQSAMRAVTYNGSTWSTVYTFVSQYWDQGDTLRIRRTGNVFQVWRNGTLLGSFSTSIARGVTYRRVALNVRMAVNIFSWYGPGFDDVRIRAN